MKKEKKEINKEAISMVANTAVKMDANFFNDFLKLNKSKIDSIVPKNPSIPKDDEWRDENFWDDSKEKDNK